MRYHPPIYIYMYCVFHHIYDRDDDNILFKKFSRYDEVSDDAENYVQFASKSLTPHKIRGEICPCQRQCKSFASGVNFSIFTHFALLSLKLMSLCEIDGVKVLAENPLV